MLSFMLAEDGLDGAAGAGAPLAGGGGGRGGADGSVVEIEVAGISGIGSGTLMVSPGAMGLLGLICGFRSMIC